jgi:hypothetical protein
MKIEGAHNMRVNQLAGVTTLAFEHIHQVRAAGQFGMQEFESDGQLQLMILGQPDLAHTAAAKQSDQFKSAQ